MVDQYWDEMLYGQATARDVCEQLLSTDAGEGLAHVADVFPVVPMVPTVERGSAGVKPIG